MGEITKVLKQAEEWIGAEEGDNKYKEIIETFESNKKYKYDGQGCCEFVCAVFIKALGLTRARKLIPIINYAEAQATKWKNGLKDKPSAGSLVYFGEKRANHVELVIQIYANGTMLTVDGNSNHTVILRTRSMRDKTIMGYGVPDFEYDADYWKDEFHVACVEDVTIKRYMRGSLVIWAQMYLLSKGYYEDGYLDGVFGTYMESEVKRWQKDNGLLADGIIGSYSLAVMVG